MKLLLHYLKYDFLRWRWLVVALWALVLLHTGLFIVAEASAAEAWAEGARSRTTDWDQIAPWLAQGTLVWAALLVVLLGAADSPVRGRTWLMTRAGDRRARVVARVMLVLLAVVLPPALGYAAMPLAAGFDAETAGHCFWLALTYAVPLALALWLWLRAWPHLPGLVVGLATAASLWLAAYAVGMQLPVAWFALSPAWLVMVVCLSLPALVCYRAVGKQGRRAAVHGWVAGLLLPVLWVAGGAVSHWLRLAFPGRLERAVFAQCGEEWTLPPAPASVPGREVFLGGGVRFYNGPSDTPPIPPSVGNLQILALSWQRPGEQEWSAWQPASGLLSWNTDSKVLVPSGIYFDKAGLSGVTDLRLRLQVKVDMVEMEVLDLAPEPDLSARGHGWIYARRTERGTAAPDIRERARVAPGVGLAFMAAHRALHSERGWGPETDAYERGGVWWYPFGQRAWSSLWPWRYKEARRIAASPTRLKFLRQDECIRTLVIPSLRVVVRAAEPETAPVPRVQKEKPPSLEPFKGYTRSSVWPWRAEVPVPAPGGSVHEATYYIHWLKTQRKLPAAADLVPFVAAWWSPCVEIAVRESLPPESALLRALVAGLPEEQHGEIVSRLRAAPWLASVVAARGWLAEAKPIVLDLVRRAKRISRDLLPLCRAFRDPVFHEWMRKDFEMDVPTVLYWESMPDLALELPPLLARAQRDGWRTFKQFQALLTGGQSEMLTRLLRDVNSGGPEITWGAGYLELSVLDAAGNPPPPTGLERSPDGQFRGYNQPPVSPEFRQWCAGLTADDFTFDRSKRRFVRKPSTPPPP